MTRLSIPDVLLLIKVFSSPKLSLNHEHLSFPSATCLSIIGALCTMKAVTRSPETPPPTLLSDEALRKALDP